MTLEIPRPIMTRVLRECALRAPNEAVGLLAARKGSTGSVQAVAVAHNRSSTPQVSFYVDSHEQWRIETAFDKQGLELIATFHSHPTKDAQPSGMDCEFMGGLVMVIVGMGHDAADVRAWRAVGGHTEEVDLVIFDPDRVPA